MALDPGTRLGPYEIVAPIGAGGMGEVYRARDTRLERTVAVKILPEHLADSDERKARFEREAKAISRLNHPHICTVHDVGEADGVSFIVMEYIEGETLAERLKRGPLPLDEALEYGAQIVDALDKAHRAGIVHRDLKPANVMLTKSGVKLLDFGLARLVEGDDDPEGSDAPTQQQDLTKEESIIGTLQYMAPEQLERKPADTRTDIFALGVVLYEMVTGNKAFEGSSQASLITAIMSAEPAPLSSIESMSPPGLDYAVSTCLAKDPDDRWQSARDLLRELKRVDATGAVPATTSSRRSRGTLVPILAALALGVIAGAAVVWTLSADTPAVVRTSIAIPPELTLDARPSSPLALSSDGTRLVYAARGIAMSGTAQQLYLRELDQFEATPIAGTGGAHSPFFSPDGEWIGFFTSTELKKVSLSGGAALKVADVTSASRGASWGPDDTIVFVPASGPLMRVSAAGGPPEPLTNVDDDRRNAHRWPSHLPDGKGVLFTTRHPTTWEISLLSLETNEVRSLAELGNGVAARYVPSGHLVYAQEGAILAVPFDLERQELTGTPVSMFDGVSGTGIGIPFIAVSATGTLVYSVGNARWFGDGQLVWVDRNGREETLPVAPGNYRYPSISPDGTRVAVHLFDEDADIWVWEFARQIMTRVTTYGAGFGVPVWTPDGRHLAFTARRDGRVSNVFLKAADGTGEAEQLTNASADMLPTSFAPDGKHLLLDGGVGINVFESDLILLSIDDGRIEQLLKTEFSERNAVVSPDGRWLAYESDISGVGEVYVRPFPDLEGRWQVSASGGGHPLWARDGRELFYQDLNGRIVAVPVQGGSRFEVGEAEVVVRAAYYTSSPLRSYDVSPDGKRFLMVSSAGGTGSPTAEARLNVIFNWFEELKQRAPADR